MGVVLQFFLKVKYHGCCTSLLKKKWSTTVVVLHFFLLLDFTLKNLKKTLDFTAESVLKVKSNSKKSEVQQPWYFTFF